VRLSMSPYQVSLNSPPNRTYTFPRIRLSSFLLAFVASLSLPAYLAEYCKKYVRVLHYVRLPYFLQLESLLAFALHAAFPRSLGGASLPPTTMPAPLPGLIFRLCRHSKFLLRSDSGNPRLDVHPDALALGVPFGS